MGYLKAAIGILSILLIIVTLFMYYSFNPDEELNLAANDFYFGDIKSSDTILNSLQSSLAPMQFQLYKSYISREQNNIDLSITQLEMAEKDALDHANFPLLLEIYINQTFNAFLTNNQKLFTKSLTNAAKFGGPNQDWVRLFNGIAGYKHKDFAKALSNINIDAPPAPLSSWMKKAFQNTFTHFWYFKHIVLANIELDNIIVAQNLIQSEFPNLSGQELDEAMFLMGYSYVKAASDQAPAESIPLYKQALGYLSKVDVSELKYHIECRAMVDILNRQVARIIESGDYQILPFYLQMLDNWKAKNDIEKIKKTLLDQFNRSITLGVLDQSKELFNVLRYIIPEGTERRTLEEMLLESIAKETLENLDQYARSGQMFTNDPLYINLSEDSNNSSFNDPLLELNPIQTLIENALQDHKVNVEFKIEYSIDLQNALKQIRNYLNKYPNISQAYVLMGEIYFLLGQLNESSKAYEKAIQLDPKNPLIYRYLSLVYEEAGQYQDAILLLLQALKFAPKNAEIWEELAELYVKTGNELDALPSFLEALNLDPENYHLLLTLGLLQVRLELPEEARQNLFKFLEFEPDNQAALTGLLKSLYNPLLNVRPADITSLEKERKEIYNRLSQIDPDSANQILESYQGPPSINAPPPEPEPNLPILPQ